MINQGVDITQKYKVFLEVGMISIEILSSQVSASSTGNKKTDSFSVSRWPVRSSQDTDLMDVNFQPSSIVVTPSVNLFMNHSKGMNANSYLPRFKLNIHKGLNIYRGFSIGQIHVPVLWHLVTKLCLESYHFFHMNVSLLK